MEDKVKSARDRLRPASSEARDPVGIRADSPSRRLTDDLLGRLDRMDAKFGGPSARPDLSSTERNPAEPTQSERPPVPAPATDVMRAASPRPCPPPLRPRPGGEMHQRLRSLSPNSAELRPMASGMGVPLPPPPVRASNTMLFSLRHPEEMREALVKQQHQLDSTTHELNLLKHQAECDRREAATRIGAADEALKHCDNEIRALRTELGKEREAVDNLGRRCDEYQLEERRLREALAQCEARMHDEANAGEMVRNILGKQLLDTNSVVKEVEAMRMLAHARGPLALPRRSISPVRAASPIREREPVPDALAAALNHKGAGGSPPRAHPGAYQRQVEHAHKEHALQNHLNAVERDAFEHAVHSWNEGAQHNHEARLNALSSPPAKVEEPAPDPDPVRNQVSALLESKRAAKSKVEVPEDAQASVHRLHAMFKGSSSPPAN